MLFIKAFKNLNASSKNKISKSLSITFNMLYQYKDRNVSLNVNLILNPTGAGIHLLAFTGADMQGGKRATAYLCPQLLLQNKTVKSYTLNGFTWHRYASAQSHAAYLRQYRLSFFCLSRFLYFRTELDEVSAANLFRLTVLNLSKYLQQFFLAGKTVRRL